MQTKPRKERKQADHSGSTFDTFLEQEGIREEVEAVAIAVFDVNVLPCKTALSST